jgi:hypothetical protein
MMNVIKNKIKEIIEYRDEGRDGVELSKKYKYVEKVEKVMGERKEKMRNDRGHSEEVELCVKILSDIME